MNALQIIGIIYFIFHVTFGQEFRQKLYDVLRDLKISETYRTVYGTRSIMKCAAECLDDKLCASANYNKAKDLCELTHHSPENGLVGIIEDQNWKIVYFKDELWKLIFRATSGIEIPTYSAYMGTATLPIPSDACKLPQTLTCTTHYRDSDVIDSWNSHNTQQVQFVLYKAGVAVVNLTFSNSDADNNTSWFSADNIIGSSYVNLNSETQWNYFGISGLENVQRRFYASETWHGCPGDAGWVCVFDVDLTGTSAPICPYQAGLSYPFFAYMPNNAKGFFATDQQSADVLAIYIKN